MSEKLFLFKDKKMNTAWWLNERIRNIFKKIYELLKIKIIIIQTHELNNVMIWNQYLIYSISIQYKIFGERRK